MHIHVYLCTKCFCFHKCCFSSFFTFFSLSAMDKKILFFSYIFFIFYFCVLFEFLSRLWEGKTSNLVVLLLLLSLFVILWEYFDEFFFFNKNFSFFIVNLSLSKFFFGSLKNILFLLFLVNKILHFMKILVAIVKLTFCKQLNSCFNKGGKFEKFAIK